MAYCKWSVQMNVLSKGAGLRRGVEFAGAEGGGVPKLFRGCQ